MYRIEDHMGRRFEKLRVSLLNTCNFSCTYCVSSGPDTAQNSLVPAFREEQLDTNDFAKLIAARAPCLRTKEHPPSPVANRCFI